MGQISKSSILENAYNLGARDMWVYAKYIDLHLAGSKRNVTKSCIVIVIVVTYFFWHLLVKWTGAKVLGNERSSIRLIGWKLRIFATPLSFNALAQGEPVGISGRIFSPRKLHPLVKISWSYSLRRFHSVSACDGRTDGQTDIPTMAIVQRLHSRLCWRPVKMLHELSKSLRTAASKGIWGVRQGVTEGSLRQKISKFWIKTTAIWGHI